MTAYDWAPVPHHLAYRACRENISALLADRPQAADLGVPACPAWSVRDAVAHLNGICRRVAGLPAGRTLEPAPGARRGEDVEPLLKAWDEAAALAEDLLARAAHGRHGIMVMDAFTHELDIRRALGEPVPDEHPAYATAMNIVAGGFSESVVEHGLPALELVTEGASWTVGSGSPVARLSASRHDLVRSLAGRRSHGQISALGWSEDASTWLPAFRWGPFMPPSRAAE